jgi:hypothetical protein
VPLRLRPYAHVGESRPVGRDVRLRALARDELRKMAIHTELGAGFLVGLQRRLQEQDLSAKLGTETWMQFHQEGIRTIGDVALLSSERIQQIAAKQRLDRKGLVAYSEARKKTFIHDAYQPAPRPFMPSAMGTFDDRQN